MSKGTYLDFLGLAMRAGKITVGEEFIVKDIQSKRAKLVLVAADTGKQTKKKLNDKCSYYQIPIFEVDDRQTISQAIGKSGRVAIAVTEKGFAKKMQSLLEEINRG
ncbi:YlxQ family RNA-binding protein [Salimicrobium jeotgali]|uniref:YlxQ family RNA-binding protein n=1 Tax=Salimicrobium jeotgali TaxID=1230341 RepID=UPI000C8449C6|nr:YlxQ family RNA-binding protein [Salimicrobium jeotgali]